MKGAHPVRFIRQAQALGFTLDEIRQLVTFDGGGADSGSASACTIC